MDSAEKQQLVERYIAACNAFDGRLNAAARRVMGHEIGRSPQGR